MPRHSWSKRKVWNRERTHFCPPRNQPHSSTSRFTPRRKINRLRSKTCVRSEPQVINSRAATSSRAHTNLPQAAAAHRVGAGRGRTIPLGDIVASTSLSSIVGCSHKKTMRACHAASRGGNAVKFPRRTFLHVAAGAAALPAVAPIARAQAYPSRPIRLVTPFHPVVHSMRSVVPGRIG